MAVARDLGERLVSDHELLLAVGRDAELPLGDLAIGAADADLEHAAGARRRPAGSATSSTRVECGDAGLDDERLHAAVRPAVDGEDRAGRELRRRQVEDGVRDLLGRAEPAHRLAGPQRVERLAGACRRAAAPRACRSCRGRRR